MARTLGSGHHGNLQGLSLEPCPTPSAPPQPLQRTREASVGVQPGFSASPQHEGPSPGDVLGTRPLCRARDWGARRDLFWSPCCGQASASTLGKLVVPAQSRCGASLVPAKQRAPAPCSLLCVCLPCAPHALPVLWGRAVWGQELRTEQHPTSLPSCSGAGGTAPSTKAAASPGPGHPPELGRPHWNPGSFCACGRQAHPNSKTR